MIDRAELKAKAKAAFKRNYWRCVVVALIMALLVGGGSARGKSSMEQSIGSKPEFSQYDTDGDSKLDADEFRGMLDSMVAEYGASAVAKACAIIVGAIVSIAAIGGLVSVLVINPLSLGCKYFFTRNSEEPAEVGEIRRGFTPAWWNNVVTMFLSGLFLTLWALLFVFPVFIKGYAYRLTPYIQAENPDMKGTEAITLSRRMMNGHKWEAFMFDLSFIGWYILAVLTASIAGVFWVAPYKAAADAELYKAIRDSYQG